MHTNLCVHVAAFTHPGLIRPHNEDCIAVGAWLGQGTMEQPMQFTLPVEEPLLCLVADGLGGHAAGEVASRYAAQRLSAEAGTLGKDESGRSPTCLHRINTEMQAEMRSHPHQVGMATTVAGLIIAPTGIIAFNVGDSRIYRRRLQSSAASEYRRYTRSRLFWSGGYPLQKPYHYPMPGRSGYAAGNGAAYSNAAPGERRTVPAMQRRLDRYAESASSWKRTWRTICKRRCSTFLKKRSRRAAVTIFQYY